MSFHAAAREKSLAVVVCGQHKPFSLGSLVMCSGALVSAADMGRSSRVSEKGRWVSTFPHWQAIQISIG